MNGRTALVLGGGGERLVAWEIGVLAGLADAGADPGAAGVLLGTSAGSWVAARTAAGDDPRRHADRLAARALAGEPAPPSDSADLYAGLAALWAASPSVTEARRLVGRIALERSPGGEGAFVAEVAATLPAGPWPTALRVATVDAVAGERVVLGAEDGFPLAAGVAASRSVPVHRPPVEVGGRRLIDGSLGSATNADALLGDVRAGRVSLVAVVSGTDARRGAGPADRLWTEALDAEVAELRAAGAVVVECRAGAAAQAAMGPDPASDAGAPLAVAAGRSDGRALAARLPALAAGAGGAVLGARLRRL